MANRFAQYAQPDVTASNPKLQPEVTHQNLENTQLGGTLPYAAPKAKAEAITAAAAAEEARSQQKAKTKEAQASADKTAFQRDQEGLVTQHQRAQVAIFGDNIKKTMDVVDQARALIKSAPGQFDPVTYRVMQHVPGTAANKFATLIDPEKGPLAANQVLNTINTFREEAGSNPGGGGSPPRVFRSEIPLFASQAGALNPGAMGAAATMHTLDNMEYYGKRSVAAVNGADLDNPATAKQFQIPSAPTMESAQAKLSAAHFNPNTDQVLFNDEGKPGQLSPRQQAQEQDYLKANPSTSPEAFNSYMSSLTGRTVVNGKDILDAYNNKRGLNSAIAPDPRAVALANQRLRSGNNTGAAAITGGVSAIPFANQIGAGIDTLGYHITGQGSPSYSVNRDANFLYNEGLAKDHPLPYYGGQLVGGAALLAGGAGAGSALLRTGKEGGSLQAILDAATNNPKMATTLGDMAYGGAANAGQNPDAPITGAAEGSLAGLTGNILGNGVQKLGGKAVSAAGQRLDALGVHVPIWPKILPGGEARVADQNQQLSREAFNQTANIVGGDSKGVGAPALTDLKSLGQDAYSHALDPVTGFPLTPEAHASVTNALNAANGLKNPAARDYALRSLNQHVVSNFGEDGMNGANFQGAYRGLSNDIGGVAKLADNGKISPSEHKALTNILGQGQDAIVLSLKSAHPDAFEQFSNTNNMWRHMNVLGKGLDAARNNVDEAGNAIPNAAQLSNASSANARSYNGVMASAQGDRPFDQLLNDANYAGAKSGGSGPAAQVAHYALPTLGLLAGGGAGGMEDGKEGASGGAITLGMLALGLGSRRGQRLLRSGLLGAPNAFTAGILPFTPNLNNGSR